MDRKEILWRLRAALSTQLDLIRVPLDIRPKLKAVPAAGQFQSGFRCLADSVSLDWESQAAPFGQWRAELVEKADLVMQDKLSFFDLEEAFLGDPINWHRDHSAGKTGKLRQSALVDYRDFDRVGDCKLVWEPNRHHQLVVLARAAKVTGDSRYARKAVELMLDWIASNRFGYGMNWKSPLEVGIRLINWVWAIDLIRDSGEIDEDAWTAILDIVYAAMWDTQRKFSEGSSANNHLIGEAAGVFIAASYFSFMPNAAEWRAKSRSVLEHQILAQTFSDGCTREHAFGYQFFVLQFQSLCAIAAQRSGEPFSDTFMQRLHQMYSFTADICSDTGRQPNMGDADNGYVLDLGNLPNEPSPLLTVGGRLFADSGLIGEQASETAWWLFGDESLESNGTSPVRESRVYTESGYCVLRADPSFEKGGRRLSAFFDCAELGYGSIAAHGHADCLSFTLNVGRLEFLVDPGTYDYFSHPEWRQYFRETRAHNTATVDGQCQSESRGPFLWEERANAELLSWTEDDEKVVVSARHDGYNRLSSPVVHKRTLGLRKQGNVIDVTDEFDCDARHEIRRYFHFAPECQLEVVDKSTIRIHRDGVELKMFSNSGDIEVVVAGNADCLGWVSPGYHVRQPSHCVVIHNAVSSSAEFVVSFTPAGS